MAVVGMSVGLLGASPAGADLDEIREDNVVKDLVHQLCDFEEIQQGTAEAFDVKANRGQCQQALREFAGV